MKLLILTQIVDEKDPVLGFFCQWITEFAKQCDHVHVICLKKGEHSLPPNVTVRSLGKEGGVSRLKYLYRFYKYTIGLRHEYDAVFIHMNQIYGIVGWPVWKLLGKKVSLWYAHGHVPLSLTIAEKCIDLAFASTPQGFRINTPKLCIVGQGIDTTQFAPAGQYERHSVITVGRISPVKHVDTIIDALATVQKTIPDVRLTVVGGEGSAADASHMSALKQQAADRGVADAVYFAGPKSHAELPALLQKADLFINMSDTGSLDKTILEALACGVPVFSSNASFASVVSDSSWHVTPRDADDLANKMIGYFTKGERPSFRHIVEEQHSLPRLISKILAYLKV